MISIVKSLPKPEVALLQRGCLIQIWGSGIIIVLERVMLKPPLLWWLILKYIDSKAPERVVGSGERN